LLLTTDWHFQRNQSWLSCKDLNQTNRRTGWYSSCSSHVQTNWRSHSVLFIKHPIPSDCKLANVSPIFRKGMKNNHGNYRPVSLTSGPRKIMDGILRDHLLDHLDANHISVTGNTDLCEDGLVPQICWKHSRNGRRP